MALRDEIQQERKKLEGKSLGKKAEYFWDYYRFHVLFLLLGLGLLVAAARDISAKKDYAFYALLLNSGAAPMADGGAQMREELSLLLDIRPDREEIVIDAGMSYDPGRFDELSVGAAERIMALIASGTLDCMLADQPLFEHFSEMGAFRDLRELYTEEELSALSERLYYGRDTESGEAYPVGIVLTDSEKLLENGLYSDSGAVLGFPGKGRHEEAGRGFVRYLLGEK